MPYKEEPTLQELIAGSIDKKKNAKVTVRKVSKKEHTKSFKIENKGEIGEEFIVRFRCGIISKTVKSSELRIDYADVEEKGLMSVLTVTFKPISVRDSRIILKAVYELSQSDRFIKKYIEICYDKKGEKKIVLDHIELSDLPFDPDLKSWCIPEQENSHMPGFSMMLGQPVYVDSFYFGCEFPASLNTISDARVSVKTYSGKTLEKLIAKDKYVSHKYVCGVSENDNFSWVQKSFYSYIRSISKPVKHRIQYNSWYDNMLNISKENVTASFLEIDKGLTKSGVRALDSYVADDGWNDYSKGFWSFNSKFPDRLEPFADLAEAFGSRFGVWVGPRGGYTNDTIKFARRIEKAGNGYVNRRSFDICVSSDKYVDKMEDMFLEFTDSFRLNYFKLDGFAQRPCRNKHHDHMVGGYKDMYFYSDLWEKWLRIFDKLYEKGGSDFWVNLTCYAPPSPWFLSHVSSVWMQMSDDIGFIGKKDTVSDKDRTLNYRDEKYYDFYKTRQFQFPQSCLYNHDPIYGNEAKISMTDEEFREYLFTMATRGTAFWELYYSHSMMNDAKWRINRSALSFVEDNLDVLSNSVIFGARPSLCQVYGYSCFNDSEGIVCLRNSSDRDMEYALKLNEEIGVGRAFPKSSITVILPYTENNRSNADYGYGDTVKVSLKPYESRIFHFNRPKKHMLCDYVKALNSNQIEVSFNQFISVNDISCDDNEIESVELLEDYMSAVITFGNAFDSYNEIMLKNVSDIMGNKSDVAVSFDYYENNLVIYGVRGKSDFSVKATLEGNDPIILMKQGDDIVLEVQENGHIRFRVVADEVISRRTVDDVVQILALRERNGVLKLYLNGELDSGAASLNVEIPYGNAYCYDNVKVKIFNRAFSYDEV